MAHAAEAALQKLLPLLRQLREIKGLKEVQPGSFQLKAKTFIQFHDEDGTLTAELKKAGGSGCDRYPVDTPAGQRKLVDDAKRRAGRALDED
jgi:hypothetical protein